MWTQLLGDLLLYFFFIIIGVLVGLGLGWFLWRKDELPPSPREVFPTSVVNPTDSRAFVELEEERDFLNAQFDLLLSKLNDNAKSNWRTSQDGMFGDLEKIVAEKTRLANKIKEFVGKVDRATRRHVSSLDEESLGVISPIRDQLESEEKSRLEVQASFNRLVGKLDPELQTEWEGLNEGSVGISASPVQEDPWRQKFETLLTKIDPEFQAWEELASASLTLSAPIIREEEALSTQDWSRSEMMDGPTWLLDSAGREPDNLKLIWGVGPVLEKTLNSIGIYYFSQLNQLTEHDDIAWVSEQIKTFPERIERDQWVKQAGLLLQNAEAVMSKPY